VSLFTKYARKLRDIVKLEDAAQSGGDENMPSMPGNRYANDWNKYSKAWDREYGAQYDHLGDEWNDDKTLERKRDAFYFSAFADRWLTPEMTALEVGPGGGKWTVGIAPKVKRLIVLDVAEEMLRRTRARCESLGITNVEYVLGNGKDFRPVPDASVDFFFSYDVFVHIALEDTWPYAQEMARVLVPGGYGTCHYAINSIPDAWDRIEQNNDWYRGNTRTLGQFYYHSPEALRRMFERCGLRVMEQHQEAWHCTCIFEKDALAIAPKLEGLLRQLISPEANDDRQRAAILAALQALPGELQASLQPVLAQARTEKDFHKRLSLAAQIRRIWRGV